MQAGGLVQLSHVEMTRLAKKGLIPAVFLPDNEIRFIEADVWAWVKERRKVGVPA